MYGSNIKIPARPCSDGYSRPLQFSERSVERSRRSCTKSSEKFEDTQTHRHTNQLNYIYRLGRMLHQTYIELQRLLQRIATWNTDFVKQLLLVLLFDTTI